MPIVRKRRVARRRRPARRVRKAGRRPFARTGRSLIARPMSQYGTVTETITISDQTGNTPNLFSVVLSSFPRSLAVTGLYQFYRLKYVKFQYIPKLALGTQVAPGDTTSVLYGRPMRFYYMMNRQGTVPASLTLNNFLEKGCKPIPFGDSRSRAVVVSYKPNLTAALNRSGAHDTGNVDHLAIEPLFHKWVNRYATDNSMPNDPGPDMDNDNVEYHGHLTWIEDFNQNALDNVNVAEIRITAVWEYKNPYMPVTAEQLNKPDAKSIIIK